MERFQDCCLNNIFHRSCVVFVFCVAILLAVAVESSPIESEDDNGKTLEGEVEAAEEHSNEAAEQMVNELAETEVAVPYGEVNTEAEGEAYLKDDDVEVEMTAEEKERVLGVGIPLCMQYNDDRNPLHLR